MGMDVYGQAPTAEVGVYFRNNVWWWRPLWNYIVSVTPSLVAHVHGHSNDGDGLEGEDALELARRLREELDSGRTAKYAADYQQNLDAMPDEVCTHCHGTGQRNDVFVKGPCNGCEGKGTRRPFDTWYPFSVENVEDFVKFLEASGGFKIC